MRANDVRLHPVVAYDFVRGKTPVIQPMGRMRFRHGGDRQIDFVEAAEFHAPENRAPCGVERVDGAVAMLQPSSKTLQRGWGITDHGVVAAELVVCLPERHSGMLAVTLGHCRANFLR